VKIEISSGSPEESLKNISLGKIDLSILDIEHYNKYSNVILKEVMINEYIFVVSKEYYERNNVNITKIEDLKKYFLILPKDTTSAKKILDKYLNDDSIKPHYGMVSEIMRKDFVQKGLGIGFVTRRVVENELQTGELIEIKLDKPNSISKVGIATLKDEISSSATKKLVEYIIKFNK